MLEGLPFWVPLHEQHRDATAGGAAEGRQSPYAHPRKLKSIMDIARTVVEILWTEQSCMLHHPCMRQTAKFILVP